MASSIRDASVMSHRRVPWPSLPFCVVVFPSLPSPFGAVPPFWGALWGVSFWLPLLIPFALLLFWVYFLLLSAGLRLNCASLLFLGLSCGSSSGSRRLSAFVSLSLGDYIYGNSRLVTSCRLVIFIAFHYSHSGCGSLSIALWLFSLSLAPPLFRCSCLVSSGCTFFVVSTWRFPSHLLLLCPLFYRQRFTSTTAVALAGHPF